MVVERVISLPLGSNALVQDFFRYPLIGRTRVRKYAFFGWISIAVDAFSREVHWRIVSLSVHDLLRHTGASGRAGFAVSMR
jgi:hypothetical protein